MLGDFGQRLWLLSTKPEAKHQHATLPLGEVLQAALTDCVHTLFDLTAKEISLIEEVAKYDYGEV